MPIAGSSPAKRKRPERAGKPLKLLIVGLNYAPEPVGIGPYTTGLAEAMAARGHRVAVVAGKPYYPQWRAYEGQPRGMTIARENGVHVTRVPHYIPREPTGARRLAHHASFAAAAYGPAMGRARHRPDLVFTVAPSMMSVPVALRAARVAGAPLWLHIQDFEVEAAFATGLLDEQSRIADAARGAEARLLRAADKVSTISPQMAARLAQKGVAAERITELRNWSNAAFGFEKAEGGAYRRQWGLGERKIALYSGNIANKQGIEIVVEAARRLATRDDICFVICGEGPNRGRLEALAAGLPNLQLHDLQPAERMGDLLALASVHLLPQIEGAADLVLPSKLTNMLRSGRPVVATAEAGTGLYEEVEGCGVLVRPGDGAGFASAIAALIDDDSRREALGRAAGERAQARWDRDALIDRFEAAAGALVRDGP